MTEDWQNIETSKATVDVEKELFKRVKSKLYYGQMSRLFRNIFESLDIIFKEDRIEEVIGYIYKRQSLLLDPKKEKTDDIDG